ncbi:copper amine oxidase N-terminal domain-containing protein [Paenibacillus sp. NEAU-GSW1]|uniref:copper amine oxidase N-terminal domain-containing protein n=1 Tax=Paenibacillus sp. NEAU-GSW1 TaxID=2682486 RepID=UPI0012E16715|nr:copper amine oxidase N-terminal domain-containing protein [Paenibacillus sp. NEAU-GSW1]MUT64973.1 hypothetical protein [Paenibacillus sp. NEAU-GSW1]
MKRVLFIWLVIIVALTAIPASALAVSDPGSPVEIRLTAGSATIEINGETSTVQAPYEASGTTMVPLSVITKAFGAALKRHDSKTLSLTYNEKKVIVTIGSKTVKVNGSNKSVAVAPVIVKDTTMVPVRVIAEAFGASIGKDSRTNEIVIKGVRASGTIQVGSNRVGDSYWGWSIAEPLGYELVEQSENGDFVYWVNENSNLKVMVIPGYEDREITTITFSQIMMLSYLEDDESYTDSSAVTIDGLSFQKLTTLSEDQNQVFEYRGVVAGNCLYVLRLGVTGQSGNLLNPYKTLLDSFKLSFDASAKNANDITKAIEELIAVHDKDYGLTLKLPSGWFRDPWKDHPSYVNGNNRIELKYSSIPEGDTPEKWLQRRQANLSEDILPDYIRNITTSEMMLNDGKALVLSYEHTYDQNTWLQEHEIHLFTDMYRYRLNYRYDVKLGNDGDELYKKMIAAVDLDTGKTLNATKDTQDVVDRTEITRIELGDENRVDYSFEIPSYWQHPFFLSDFLAGGFYGYDEDNYIVGFKQKYVTEDSLNQFIESITLGTYLDEGKKLISVSNITIDGNRTVKFVQNDSILHETKMVYYIFKNDQLIGFTLSARDANLTPSTLKRFEDIMQSLKIY